MDRRRRLCGISEQSILAWHGKSFSADNSHSARKPNVRLRSLGKARVSAFHRLKNRPAQVPDALSWIAKDLTHAIERGLDRRRGAYGLGQIEARPGEQLADLRQLVADGDQLARDLGFGVVGHDDTVAEFVFQARRLSFPNDNYRRKQPWQVPLARAAGVS